MDPVSEDDLQSQVEFDFSCLFSSRDEFSSKNISCGVKGHLISSINFCETTLNAPEFVFDTIRRGYRLPFAEYPPLCFLANNRSAFRHSESVAQAISELLANGCDVERSDPPFWVNPLTVAEGKKLRPVISNFLLKFKFRYEDLRSLSQVVEEGHWFFTWDLA